jgi:MOSC domain-containing protein YiiM
VPKDKNRAMELQSVNVGLPQTVLWHGQEVITSIFKSAVAARTVVNKLNLTGDRQADLSVHGGPDKAVYCYASEHYGYWKNELPGWTLPPGAFGENFTTLGLPEASVHIGDCFRIGSAEFVVTQPRLPCFKLGLRFQSDDMVRRFLVAGRFGFYFAVAKEGEVGAGDKIERISADGNAVRVSEIVRLYVTKSYTAGDVQSVRTALRTEALPLNWKEYLSEKLETMDGVGSAQ